MNDAISLLEALPLEDGRPWGDVACGHQLLDAEAILDLNGPRRHFVTRPRGGSKTTDAAAVAIPILLYQAPPASRSYIVAADKDQGGLVIDALAGLVERAGLNRQLRVSAFSVENLANAATLEVLAADASGAWGKRPYVVIVDELAQWDTTRRARRMWSAIVSAMPKVADSRLICLTSAGEPSHWSHKVRVTAATRADWRLSEMPGPVPWHSTADLESAAASLLPSEYARLHLNQWTESEDRLTSIEAVLACADNGRQRLAPIYGTRYVIGVDFGLVDDPTVIAVAHAEAVTYTDPTSDVGEVGYRQDVRIVVDHVMRWQGSRRRPVSIKEVGDAIRDLARAYSSPGRKAKILVDRQGVWGEIQALHEERFDVVDVPVTEAINDDVARNLWRLLQDGRLSLPDDQVLIDEFCAVRLEKRGDRWKVEHDTGQHNDQVFAIGLAARALLTTKSNVASVRIPGGSTTLGNHRAQTVAGAARGDPIDQRNLARNRNARIIDRRGFDRR